MDSALKNLSKAPHNLVNGEGRALTWFWRKVWSSGFLNASSSNRSSQCFGMKESWRNLAQWCLESFRSRFAIVMPWRKQNMKWSSSWDLMVQKTLKWWLGEEGSKIGSSVLGILLRNSKSWKWWFEEMREFCVFAAASRVENDRKITLYLLFILA